MKPDFFRSRSLAECAPAVRLTFVGMWTEADDIGDGVADAKILKGALWALDDEITPETVESHLIQLWKTGHIQLYEVGGLCYYAIINWEKHQSAAYRRGEARYPQPAEGTTLHDFALCCTILHDQSCKKVQDGEKQPKRPDGQVESIVLHDSARSVVQKSAVREGKGREGKGEEAGASQPARSLSRATQLSKDWKPTDELLRWAAEKHPHISIDAETEKFVNHFVARGEPKKNWEAAWRNWILRAKEFGRSGSNGIRDNARDGARLPESTPQRREDVEAIKTEEYARPVAEPRSAENVRKLREALSPAIQEAADA